MKKYQQLSNYNKNDTIATGLERPKTTSLFFDKIWIPSDFKYSEYGEAYGYYDIPPEVCVEDKNEENLVRGLEIMPFAKMNYPIRSEKIRYKKYLDFMPYVDKNVRIRPDDKSFFDELLNIEIDKTDTNKEEKNKKKEKSITLKSDFEFLYSHNRNIGIKDIIVNFRQIYGIEITPIFISKTKFEESIQATYIDEQNKNENCDVLEVSINYIPAIVEDKLSWEQVLDLRRDKVSKDKLKRLKYWINLELKDKSREEIISTLDKMIDDYEFALKKHGVLTTIGGFTSILSSSSTVIEAITKDFSGILSASFVVTAGIVTFTTAQIIDFLQAKRDPVAFIYDVFKKI